MARHQRLAGRRSFARSAGMRLTGLLLYSAAVFWTWWQLRDAMVFVVPAAVGGGLLHVWRGRPWLGLVVFWLMVVLLPILVVPALGTGFWADFRQGWE
ncbi:hypothetical protein [Nocardioides jishulii]|uniref:Uncharacterized protein n=1 Tax=Nocardioides jishulii TaxID=2575440 RepID=A0A4U2YU21_9ACTN|nr:hypothetical protein [Nocardioides jishulii]QCX26572.1 hypothetical protein FCL41_02695 [Nocardioides jishulii]TKI63621.1 hypothetical protein FC770_00010 [Nocardioides jishulii]